MFWADATGQPDERRTECGATHTFTVAIILTPLPRCDGAVYRGNRHHNVCEYVGLDTNQGLQNTAERDVLE